MTMNGRICRAGLILSLALWSAVAAHADDSRLGLGVRYWRTTEGVGDRDIDRDGPSWFITYQRRVAPLIAWQADLELFSSRFAGSTSEVFAPQAFAVLGGWVYGALGAGILYADGRFADRPFFLARLGLDLKVLPRTRVDLHASYVFSEWGNINRIHRDFQSNVASMGAAVRFEF
jgi:hypothetical protein